MLRAKLTVGVLPPYSKTLGVQPKLNKAAPIKLKSNLKYGREKRSFYYHANDEMAGILMSYVLSVLSKSPTINIYCIVFYFFLVFFNF